MARTFVPVWLTIRNSICWYIIDEKSVWNIAFWQRGRERESKRTKVRNRDMETLEVRNRKILTKGIKREKEN